MPSDYRGSRYRASQHFGRGSTGGRIWPFLASVGAHQDTAATTPRARADALFRGLPTTLLRTSFYWDNLIHFGMGPRRGEDGTLSFLLPMGDQKLPGIAAADIGACAFGIFKRGSGLIGQTIGIAGEHLTGSAMSAELSEVLGEPVRHVSMPHALYAQLGFPGAEDLANMFQYKCDFNAEFRAQRPVALSRELHPGLLSFGQWLGLHRDGLQASLQEKP